MEQKKKVFRDATLGYIAVEDKYVTNLIDTFEMQRLKDVAQTGIRPIYSGATHDRFSHSLGVYHIGRSIYPAFRNNLVRNLKVIFEAERIEEVEKILNYYEEYYYIGCLLHDIGHPAFSHTFEYIYKNKYINLSETGEEIARLKTLLNVQDIKQNTLDKVLENTIKKDETFFFVLNKTKGNQMVEISTERLYESQGHHEKMGAYQILISSDIKQNIRKCFFENDEKSVIDYCFIACMITGLQYEDVTLDKGEDKEKVKLETSIKNCIIRLLNGLIDADSIDYLNRNSHFAGYSTSVLDVERLCNAFSGYYDKEQKIIVPCFEKSALSAIEGFISARNFEPKWLYNHHKIIYHDEYLIKYLYKKCNRYLFANIQSGFVQEIVEMMKTELEEIDETIIEGEENNTQGNGELIAYILNTSCNRFFKNRGLSETDINVSQLLRFLQNMEEIKTDSDTQELLGIYEKECLVELKDVFKGIKGSIKSLESSMELGAIARKALLNIGNSQGDYETWLENVRRVFVVVQKYCKLYGALKDAFFVDVFAPINVFRVGEFRFLKTSDSDIEALIKMMYLRYNKTLYSELTSSERVVGTEKEYIQFVKALKEFVTRRYRQSLWKSENEYKLMLKQIENETGLSIDTINVEFLNLISSPQSTIEEFEDPDVFSNRFDCNAVYVNNTHEDGTGEFTKIFSRFGDGMVIKIYRLKYKDFSNLTINFGSFGWEGGSNDKGACLNTILYGTLGEKKKKVEYFPYLFYDEDEIRQRINEPIISSSGLQRKLLGELKDAVVEYLLRKFGEGGDNSLLMSSYIRDGKVIRDSVHGDIFIPERFLKIIDTKAFQRLRRIKQLATADLVFPEATHTRFSHSLGVFHIMSLMMEHFCQLFDYLKIEYSQTDKDAILVAALLHDIGHGPYSHAFENVLECSHEEWTQKIIEEDKELNALLKEFDDTFPEQVIRYMNYSKSGVLEEKYTLSSVFAALINSQLDADRLDYLMRDAYNTGTKLGIVDLQNVIASLELTKHDGSICVCVNEDAVAYIEQIILGRYNMYKRIYNAPYKVFLEELLNQIIKKIKSDKNLLKKCKYLNKLVKSDISTQEYLQLDDYSLYQEIVSFSDCEDKVLSYMVKAFCDRNGYKRLRVLDEMPVAIDEFRNEFIKRFGIHQENMYGLICPTKRYSAYTGKKDKAILISKRNGSISDLVEESVMFKRTSEKRKGEDLWQFVKKYMYINYDILLEEIPALVGRIKEIEEFVESYDIRRHTEIEEKYSCKEEDIKNAKELVNSLINNNTSRELSCYNFEEDIKEKEQQDCYYDTEDFLLAKRGYSLRCRTISGEGYVFSIKCSIDNNNGSNNGQFVRSEFERKSETDKIDDKENQEFINRHLRLLLDENNKEFKELVPVVAINNLRTSIYVSRKDSNFKCEISLDSIEYKKYENFNGSNKKDYQIEIELKSHHHIHKVELKEFAERFLKALSILKIENEAESKYRKALISLDLI